MRKSEQETTVTFVRDEPFVYIYTCNPVDLRRLRKDVRVVETSPGVKSWGQFRVPITDFDPLRGFRRRGRRMTPEQRESATARLVAGRRDGATLTYSGAHARLHSIRGEATEYRCSCGAKAQQWAYRHDDPVELTSATGAYSADPSHYDPMCTSCHKRFDLARIRGAS